MLSQIIKEEADKRVADEALKASIRAEADAIARGLHEAIAPDVEALGAWKLRPQYGRERTVASVQTYPSWPECLSAPQGLVLELGEDMLGKLSMVVQPRTPGQAGEVQVHFAILRNYPYKCETLGIFPGHTPAASLVELFLRKAVALLPMGVA